MEMRNKIYYSLFESGSKADGYKTEFHISRFKHEVEEGKSLCRSIDADDQAANQKFITKCQSEASAYEAEFCMKTGAINYAGLPE
jgi:hypothetical protein